MAYNSIGSPIVKELLAAGIIPPNCRTFSFELKAGCLLRASYEVIITEEQFRKIADVLIADGMDAAYQTAKLTVFSGARLEKGDTGMVLHQAEDSV